MANQDLGRLNSIDIQNGGMLRLLPKARDTLAKARGGSGAGGREDRRHEQVAG